MIYGYADNIDRSYYFAHANKNVIEDIHIVFFDNNRYIRQQLNWMFDKCTQQLSKLFFFYSIIS